jgi:hypothetical protein
MSNILPIQGPAVRPVQRNFTLCSFTWFALWQVRGMIKLTVRQIVKGGPKCPRSNGM